jgi:hypothetical protein
VWNEHRASRIDAADAARRSLDVIVCTLLLVLLAIPMLVIAPAVPAEDRGPAFYRQQRVGLRGNRFMLLKFRTMFRGGDRQLRDLIARELRGEDTVQNGSSKLNNDRRVSRTGAFLRRTSLDELPQRPLILQYTIRVLIGCNRNPPHSANRAAIASLKRAACCRLTQCTITSSTNLSNGTSGNSRAIHVSKRAVALRRKGWLDAAGARLRLLVRVR